MSEDRRRGKGLTGMRTCRTTVMMSSRRCSWSGTSGEQRQHQQRRPTRAHDLEALYPLPPPAQARSAMKTLHAARSQKSSGETCRPSPQPETRLKSAPHSNQNCPHHWREVCRPWPRRQPSLLPQLVMAPAFDHRPAVQQQVPPKSAPHSNQDGPHRHQRAVLCRR